jgi:pantoate--beta-alanine ligase
MLAQPTMAFFGWKDAQQFLVLRRMVRDLAVPVELIAMETVREPDGLAISSRNAYLTAEQRANAPKIYEGLCAARRAFDGGERRAAELVRPVREAIESSPQLTVEYIEARRLDTLDGLEMVEPGNTLLAIAVRLTTARLIDNVRL